MSVFWCNGGWMEAGDFLVSPSDRGLMHGLGLFESVLAWDGRPVFVDRHLARLEDGCRRLGWALGEWDFPEVMAGLLEKNRLCDGRARIRLGVTAGSGSLQDLAMGEDHLVWMSAAPALDPPLEMSANLSPWTRNERSAIAGLKCASYAENLIALEAAARLGFDETVFLNGSGFVCEAAMANVFVVCEGRILTPALSSGCLPGVTRSVVLELASDLGISCEEGLFDEEVLRAADELFLTSSIRGVVPVSKFEGRVLGCGPMAQTLREEWLAAASGKNDA